MKKNRCMHHDGAAGAVAARRQIPWSDPAFSRRLLKIHLSQAHDWASRRFEVIDRQVEWIRRHLPQRPSRILDLCCGPGFYAHRLAALGHRCVGVDFSPASIDYARQQARKEQLDVEYILTDLCDHEIEGKYDLVMMVFGEFNVFPREDIRDILTRACASLDEGGLLVCELHSFDEVRRQGLYPPQCESVQEGLFLDTPHVCMQMQYWDEVCATAVSRYWIIDANGVTVGEYGSTLHAYTDEQIREMLAQEGMTDICKHCANEWPAGDHFNDKLQLFSARRPRISPVATTKDGNG